MNRRRLAAVLAATTAFGLAVTAGSPTAVAHGKDDVPRSARELTRAVTVKGVLQHLRAFQHIANANDGNRAAGHPGYAASVRYVVHQLKRAGYHPTVQQFDFEYFQDLSELVRVEPDATTFVNGEDFLRNGFNPSPAGEATGQLVPVDLVAGGVAPDSGCEEADFDGFPAGGIALIQRGACAFTVKALNAQAAGAAGVILFNNEDGLVTAIGDATGLTIPVVFATIQAGTDLAGTPGATVRVRVDYTVETRQAWNVLAQTHRGNTSNVVMAGAHLDSVREGPGINDNGSGSAALLETAIQMRKVKPRNAVRFAWWGAEEEGLLGSEHYVAQLVESSPDQIPKIALYLNFDMIASPNYTFGIYDGDNSSGTAPDGFIPPGSAEIEDQFEKYYTSRGKPFVDTEFSGRSDYGPFIAVQVAAGGLFTGAEDLKTEQEAATFGGVAGAALDPCYHQACDNLTGEGQDKALYDQLRQDYKLVGNVNVGALDANSDALATVVWVFSRDVSTVRDAQVPAQAAGSARVAGEMAEHGHSRATR
jgi:Zn-dependent M28 family amino/carboxypeptidase